MYVPKSLQLNTFEDAPEVSPRKLFSKMGAQPLGKPDYQVNSDNPTEENVDLIPIKEFNNLKESIRQSQMTTKQGLTKAIEFFSKKTGQEFPDLIKELDAIFV